MVRYTLGEAMAFAALMRAEGIPALNYSCDWRCRHCRLRWQRGRVHFDLLLL